MQRRWATIYLVFFLVMAASAYSVMAVAEEPTMDLEGDTFTEGDTLEAGGTTYTVATVDGEEREGTVEFEEVTAQQQTFANNSVVAYRDGEYNVTVESGDDPGSFTLTEEFDVEAILEADGDVDNRTFESDDGTEFVRYRNGTTQPLAEYLPEPDRESFAVGDEVEHDGVTKTVESVDGSGAVVAWEAPVEQSVGFDEGETVTLGGTEYVATFVDADTVLLSPDVEGYERTQQNRATFQQRMSGLLYVLILSGSASFLLAGLAFLPRRG